LGTEGTLFDPFDTVRTVVAWFGDRLNSFWVGQDGGAAILLFKKEDGAGFGTVIADLDRLPPLESTNVTLLVEEVTTHATRGPLPAVAERD
jgi:hypothetical protein